MGKLYLIQRGTFKENISKDIVLCQLGNIVNWDYMGAAEFEFGAMSKAYTRILKDLDKYDFFFTDKKSLTNNKRLVLFCRKDRYDKVMEELELYIKEGYQLKEFSGIREHFSTNVCQFNLDFSQRFNFWWSYNVTFDEKNPELLGDFIMYLDSDDNEKTDMIKKSFDALKDYWNSLSKDEKEKRISRCNNYGW
jgi:hypothetical protein